LIDTLGGGIFKEIEMEMGRAKKIIHDYSDLERFPKRPTINDFSNLEKVKWNFVYIQTLGPNIRIYNQKKSDYISLCNWDLHRINAPFFNDMDSYKNVIRNYLSEKSISFQEFLF